jgi:hypothetical protein
VTHGGLTPTSCTLPNGARVSCRVRDNGPALANKLAAPGVSGGSPAIEGGLSWTYMDSANAEVPDFGVFGSHGMEAVRCSSP